MNTIEFLESRIKAIETTLEYEYLNDRTYTKEFAELCKELNVLKKALRKLKKIYK